ncbi:MAG: RNA pseudouridine synthase [Myxococcales bacterium]|nr:RNA pseudouridine synthase [Myxococcales bacterium]
MDRNSIGVKSELPLHTAPRIVWQGGGLVALDKPPGWLAIPGRQGAADVRPVAGHWLQAALATPVLPVHRLDVPVSGLLLFALDAAAHRALNDGFASRLIGKTYEAWTADAPTGMAAGVPVTWRSRLAKGKKRAFEAPHGKPAETVAVWLGPIATAGGPLQAWRLLPLTGRSHQLRVHLAAAGCPIVGDDLYGGLSWSHGEGIALRAVQVDLANLPEQARRGWPVRFQVQGLAARFDIDGLAARWPGPADK